MEMRNMVVIFGLLLIAVFALPALATTFDKDIIFHETVQAILEKAGSDSMLDEGTVSALTGKTIISNPILEEALLKHFESIDLTGQARFCNETCIYNLRCYTASLYGCYCTRGVCNINSLA